MMIEGTSWRPVWEEKEKGGVGIIDQTKLPFRFVTMTLRTVEDAARAIRDMHVRGAPLIGATAAYGVALAMRQDASNSALQAAHARLLATRPTAVNLRWALDDMIETLLPIPDVRRLAAAMRRAGEIVEEDIEINRRIGLCGLDLLRRIAARKGRINVLTHCNAGWLATCDWGTATAPVYLAHDEGLDVHVWVDETRPRNQGASLTAWELHNHGIDHTVIVDNAGGHLMRRGEVDIVLVGADRVTRAGDVCNKIGTYLKALAARDNEVPFYVALPSPTIDWSLDDGVAEIPIEDRPEREVTHILGLTADGIGDVQVTPEGTSGGNPAFDVTPNRLVTGLITERGVCEASAQGLAALFPEKVA